ncbi:hypothetical protein JCGZ_03157 [Jatropha curcas]|uniref:Uncharacterized protein n=1 Tax=Jatropha curcas TaxID=180498 RepID=A0A067KXW0_JATCU|nr:hypothetical protein JCGZ_03157 [Jatropha curcas]
MLSTRSIRLEQDIAVAQRGSAATDHLAFMPGTYAIFVRTQLLFHIPPLTEFDPFVEAEDLDEAAACNSKHGCQCWQARAQTSCLFLFYSKQHWSNYTGMLEMHFVSISNYNEVSQFYEAACLKLVVARLSEFNIIPKRIPMVEEVPVVPQLNIDPASLILPIFDFSAYEIPSYDFDADVVPLQPLVDCALSMDCTSPYWPSLVCFCILTQYLLLNGIDGY